MTDQELIEQVAVEVMGWETSYHADPAHRWWITFDEHSVATYHIRFTEWNPLTDLNHAFMVVKRMESLRWFITLNRYVNAKTWMVKFEYDSDPNNGLVIKTDKSLGHAICLAALEVVGAKDER